MKIFEDMETGLLIPVCPFCDGEGAYMGTLGTLEHFQCRDCGAQWSNREDSNDEY